MPLARPRCLCLIPEFPQVATLAHIDVNCISSGETVVMNSQSGLKAAWLYRLSWECQLDSREKYWCLSSHASSPSLDFCLSLKSSSVFDNDIYSLQTVSWSVRDVLSMRCEVSASTISMFRHSLSPSMIYLFYQNLEDLDMFNLDLFYQNESNTQGSYLKDFGTDIEILIQKIKNNTYGYE